MHQEGRDDFTSGVTVDLGFGFTGRFDVLNVEGEGFGGMANLMADPSDFGVVRRLSVTSTPRPRRDQALRRRPAGPRARPPGVGPRRGPISVGARFYGVPAGDPRVLDGDILQVLVYDRVLDEGRAPEVEAYLAARLGGEDPIVRPGKPVVGSRSSPCGTPRRSRSWCRASRRGSCPST
jgi:hypothetical protein